MIASAGPRRAAFPPDQPLHGGPASPAQRRFDESHRPAIGALPGIRPRADGLNPAVGYAYLATAIDDGYAASLASQLRTSVTVMASDEVIGSTLSSTERSALLRRGGELPLDGTLDLADEPWRCDA